MNTISSTDDIIDSRDVVARIEDLEGERKPFAAGCNMPGYMPDNAPSIFATWDDARDAIVSDMQEAIELAQQERETLAGDDAALVAELQEAIDNLEAATAEADYGQTIGSWHYWITTVDGADAFENVEDFEELCALKALAAEAEGYSPDWSYGATLIRYSYFKTYAQEFADDIGAINSDATWPNNCIDWDRATRELQMDYTQVDFDGVTYWVR
jgi:hypothetical protein